MSKFSKNILSKLKQKSASVAVVGLGYVGRPLLRALSDLYSVIGYDIDEKQVAHLKSLSTKNVVITDRPEELVDIAVYIVCVPTDIHADKTPDLSHLHAASHMIGQQIQPGAVVIFESTVYPGCTEEECIPILAFQSDLVLNEEFWVGYAPERLVPGVADKNIQNVPRVVGGSDEECALFMEEFYASFVQAPIHRASSLKVAEASKIVENIQRDLNISLMNELSIIFDKMDIDTEEVLDAAASKWNFHPYYPGLVGGHCISVDPFYLLYKARTLGIEPNVIAAGRAINEYLPVYIAQKLNEYLENSGKKISTSKVLIYGATFKENVADLRNSKVLDLIDHLKSLGADVIVIDPKISSESAAKYQLPLLDGTPVPQGYDAIIIAVKHSEFSIHTAEYFLQLLKRPKILFDLKRIIARTDREKFAYWAL